MKNTGETQKHKVETNNVQRRVKKTKTKMASQQAKPAWPTSPGHHGKCMDLTENYAHIEIVVAFLVVNFFGFLLIARCP